MEEGKMTKKNDMSRHDVRPKKHTHKYEGEVQFKLVVQQKMLKKCLSA